MNCIKDEFTIVSANTGSDLQGESRLNIAFPPENVNIKFYGVDKVIQNNSFVDGIIMADNRILVLSNFKALNGSATLLPDIARKYPDHVFVMFAICVPLVVIRNYIKRWNVPQNMIVYSVIHPNKGGKKDYNRMSIMRINGNEKIRNINCPTSDDYDQGSLMRIGVLYNLAKQLYPSIYVRVQFGYAFDNAEFQSYMINWFIDQFNGFDFARLGIKYIAMVAGSGLMSYLLCRALELIGVKDIKILLVAVGAKPKVNCHGDIYETQIIKSSLSYLENFNFDMLPEIIRETLANVGVNGAGYDGKVFLPFCDSQLVSEPQLVNNLLTNCESACWENTLFVLVRNGY